MKLKNKVVLAILLLAIISLALKLVMLVVPLAVSAVLVQVTWTLKVFLGRKMAGKIEENEEEIKQKIKEEVL